MKEATFTNKVDIHGEGLQLNELSEEKRQQVAALLADRFMEAAGFRRKNA